MTQRTFLSLVALPLASSTFFDYDLHHIPLMLRSGQFIIIHHNNIPIPPWFNRLSFPTLIPHCILFILVFCARSVASLPGSSPTRSNYLPLALRISVSFVMCYGGIFGSPFPLLPPLLSIHPFSLVFVGVGTPLIW